MIICHCCKITDRLLRQAVSAGTTDLRALMKNCGAGSKCGGCKPALTQMLAQLQRSKSCV